MATTANADKPIRLTETETIEGRIERLSQPLTLIPDPEERPILRPSEVAALLKWSKNTVYTLIHSGELEAIRVRGRFWIPTAALREYLRLSKAS